MLSTESSTHLEQVDDESAPFRCGIDPHHLVLYAEKSREPFEIKAWLPKIGVVEITNKGTINNELKYRAGNNLKLLAHQSIVYVTQDIVRLLALDPQSVRKRLPEMPVQRHANDDDNPENTGVHVISGAVKDDTKKTVGF